MFLRRRNFLLLLSAIFPLILVLSSVLVLTRNTISAQATAHPAKTAQPTVTVPLSGQRSAPVPVFSQTNLILAFARGISRHQQLLIEGMAHVHEVRPLGIDNAYLVTVPSGRVPTTIHLLS